MTTPLQRFAEVTNCLEFLPELESVRDTVEALQGSSESSFLITAVTSLMFKAGLPRFVIDRCVLLLALRTPEQLYATHVGVVNNDTLCISDAEVVDRFVLKHYKIGSGFPEVEAPIPMVTLLFSVAAIEKSLESAA